MNLRSVAVLACRILAIVTFVRVLETSSGAFNQLASNLLNPSLPTATVSPTPFFLTTLFLQFSPMALLLMFALFLWTQADFISAKMVGENDENMTTVPVNMRTQALAFSVLGGYLLTQALPQATRMITMFLVINDQSPRRAEASTPDATFVLAQIALGLYLLFGARGLVMLLANIRSPGRSSQSQESDDDSVSLRPEK